MEQPAKNKYAYESFKVLGVAFELGFIIALPIVIFGYLGKWLDARHHTRYFLFLGIVLALAASGGWIYARLKSMVDNLTHAAMHGAKKTEEQPENSGVEPKDNQNITQ